MSQGPSEPPRVTMTDVLQLPDDRRQFIVWLMRRDQATLAEALAQTGLDETACRALLDALLAAGFVQLGQRDGAASYKAVLSNKRPRPTSSDLWKNLQV